LRKSPENKKNRKDLKKAQNYKAPGRSAELSTLGAAKRFEALTRTHEG